MDPNLSICFKTQCPWKEKQITHHIPYFKRYVNIIFRFVSFSCCTFETILKSPLKKSLSVLFFTFSSVPLSASPCTSVRLPVKHSIALFSRCLVVLLSITMSGNLFSFLSVSHSISLGQKAAANLKTHISKFKGFDFLFFFQPSPPRTQCHPLPPFLPLHQSLSLNS